MAPDPRAVVALGGYDGRLGDESDATHTLQHTARRIDLLAAWADRVWRFGVRYSYGSNWANLYTVPGDRLRSISTWASRQLTPQWSVFARCDHTWPSRLQDPSRRGRYADAGVEASAERVAAGAGRQAHRGMAAGRAPVHHQRARRMERVEVLIQVFADPADSACNGRTETILTR